VGPVVLGDAAEQPRRDDRGDGQAVGPLAAAQEMIAQQGADVVAGEALPSALRWRPHRQPVGVGVVGQHQVGLDLVGQRERQVEDVGLLGVRKRGGRELGVGFGLGRHDVGIGVSGPFEHRLQRGRPHPVHRRVDDGEGLGRPSSRLAAIVR